MNIPIIAGGKSLEREISFKSAENIFKSLKNLGYNPIIIDLIENNFIEKIQNYKFAFNIVHGDYGEDGRLASLLEFLEIDYTCSKPESCFATYDKYTFYSLYKNLFPMPETIYTTKFINNPFEFPLIIKPRKSGSSKGVFIIHNKEEYERYLNQNLKEFHEILIQKYIKGTEITISYIQKKEDFILLPILEIIPKKEFYDYEAKYTDGLTNLIPWRQTPEKILNKIENIGKTILNLLQFKDMLRIDAILTKDEVYVLEVNTVPGLTNLSDLPTSAKAVGITFDDLIRIILQNHNIY